MMDSIAVAGLARYSHELPAQVGESSSCLNIMPHCHWESCHSAATALEKPRMELKPIESFVVNQMGAHEHSVGSKDAEEE